MSIVFAREKSTHRGGVGPLERGRPVFLRAGLSLNPLVEPVFGHVALNLFVQQFYVAFVVGLQLGPKGAAVRTSAGGFGIVLHPPQAVGNLGHLVN